jgi:hypothetical protein
MVLCEWDAPEGDPGQSCVHLFARILSTSFSSVSIFSVCCYSRVSISMGKTHSPGREGCGGSVFFKTQDTALYSTYIESLGLNQIIRQRGILLFFLFPGWTVKRES